MSGRTSPQKSVTAFVSWAHGDAAWQQTVLDFVYRLRAQGIDADVDLFEQHNFDVNWSTYGPNAIKTNEFVLIVVSRAYQERWTGENDPSVGAGAAREANVLKAVFDSDQKAFYRRVKVVLLPGADKTDIPSELGAAVQRFQIDPNSDTSFEDLLRTLTAQPAHLRSVVTPVPSLPPKTALGAPGDASPSPRAPSARDIDIPLDSAEEVALGLVATDPVGYSAGAWTYPLHYALTRRGLTEVQATLALSSLVSKSLLEQVERESRDRDSGRPSTAPAYKLTDGGLEMARRSERLRQFRAEYCYDLDLLGGREQNEPFLQALKKSNGVHRQTRFIDGAESGASRIRVWSDDPIALESLRTIGLQTSATIVDWQEV
ncbi:MAG TPA: SEFIR domain-containing protein [Solirubrobacteraceae bacterium]|jgi:hypothetical protein